MAWLTGGWGKRIEITQSGFYVDSDLEFFPVLLSINKTAGTGDDNTAVVSIFTELGLNKLKLAVTMADGTTELNVEIEQWDYNSGSKVDSEAAMWCSKTGEDTVLAAGGTYYIYYDSTHADSDGGGTAGNKVGDVADGSVATKGVWNADFLGVYHLNGSYNGTADEVLDSTTNGFDGTATDAPTQVAGKIGNAQDFEAADKNYITLGTQLGKPAAYTIEYWLKAETWATMCFAISSSSTGQNKDVWGLLHRDTAETIEVYGSDGTDGDTSTDAEWNSTFYPDDTFVRVVATFASKTAKYYRDGAEQDSEVLAYDNEGTAYDFSIGRLGAYNGFYADGIVDEVRVSDAARSAAWIKADFYCQDDALLSWGSEELGTSIKLVMGVPIANVKTINGVAIADVKSFLGVSNVD